MEELVPKDHGEVIAVFRSQVIGPLVHRALTRGDLRAMFVELSKQCFRPPGSESTKCFSVPTLQRWYYRFRKGGAAALVPKPRSDRGHAKALAGETRDFVLAVRREHPSASAQLIVSTLVARGRIAKDAVSASTVRRLLQEAGLDRKRVRATTVTRLRWEAAHPGALWHGDVCHGPVIGGDGRWVRPKIHALLDDRSRFVVVLEARTSESEADMLSLFVTALVRWGRPGALYLDNGSTYSGEALAVACARLGTALVHAKPYDPEARGKMERFWRTLRQKCLDFVPRELSLAELQLRLDKFLLEHYQREPHEGLFGDTPGIVWEARQTQLVSDDELAKALTVERTRHVTKDGIVSIDGALYEVRQGFLAGHRVTVRSCLVAGLAHVAEVLHDGQRFQLRPLDRAANGKTRRPPRAEPAPRTVDFDPTAPAQT
jgi:putative transposase